MRIPVVLPAVAAVAALVAGCGAKIAPPSQLPSYRMDAPASEVSYHRKDARVSENDAATIRQQLADGFDDMILDRHDLASAVPARFKAEVVEDVATWPAYMCVAYLLTPFACPSEIRQVEVSLVVEVGGKRYEGFGKASRWLTLYGSSEGVRREAAGLALENAVQKTGKPEGER